jgi:hypothetical protein
MMPTPKTSRAQRDPLAALSLKDELAARRAPGRYPDVDALIATAEALRPDDLAEQHCRIAVHRAVVNLPSALGHLRTGRAFRAGTPLGGNPGRTVGPTRPSYMEDDE